MRQKTHIEIHGENICGRLSGAFDDETPIINVFASGQTPLGVCSECKKRVPQYFEAKLSEHEREIEGIRRLMGRLKEAQRKFKEGD